jgi:hypothetical protein
MSNSVVGYEDEAVASVVNLNWRSRTNLLTPISLPQAWQFEHAFAILSTYEHSYGDQMLSGRNWPWLNKIRNSFDSEGCVLSDNKGSILLGRYTLDNRHRGQ